MSEMASLATKETGKRAKEGFEARFSPLLPEKFSAFEQTIANPVSCGGVGLHTGLEVDMTIKPALPGEGIVFERVDLGGVVIPASYDRVMKARLCSMIHDEAGASVSTVEHLMAALAGLGIDNARIEIDGPEVPALDGSAAGFVELIVKAGIVSSGRPRRYLKICKKIEARRDDCFCSFEPADRFRIEFSIDFARSAIGNQSFDFEVGPAAFERDISPARTYGFLDTVKELHDSGLALGGSLDNAIVIDGDQLVNGQSLRFKNEFVRHKVLDALGDLYLAGHSIIGLFRGVKSGHAMTNILLRELFDDPTAYQWVDYQGNPFKAVA